MGSSFGGNGDDDDRAVGPSRHHHRDPIPTADRVCQAHRLETVSRR